MPPGFVPARWAGCLGHRGGRRRRDGLPALLGAAALADLEGHLARGGAGEVRLPEAGELIIPPYTSPERSPSRRPISEVCRDRHSASTSSCRAGGAVLEGPVHGGPGHGEQLGQIGDGVVAGGVHAPQFGLLLGRELGLAASESAPARRPCPFGCASDEEIVRGWMNYYGAFYPSALNPLLARINACLLRWLRKHTNGCAGRRKAQNARPVPGLRWPGPRALAGAGGLARGRGLAAGAVRAARPGVRGDSTSAHRANAARHQEAGIQAVDPTLAAIGPLVCPPVNLGFHIDAPNFNMITCGGQATIPIVSAVSSVVPVPYAEMVVSIASRSAGPGTRASIDEFTVTTSRAIEKVGGAERGKAILVLSPDEPPMIMRATVFCAIPASAGVQPAGRFRGLWHVCVKGSPASGGWCARPGRSTIFRPQWSPAPCSPPAEAAGRHRD